MFLTRGRLHNDSSIVESTKQKYRYLESVIEQYQFVFEKELDIIDCNKDFFQNLEGFLFDYKKLMKSTIRRVIKNLKTVLYDARNNGIETNPQIHFKIKRHKEGDVVFLTFDELDKLNNLEINDKTLINTRDWLLIGCFTGQRVSDFMRFDKNCVRKYKDKNENEFELIEITQIKTKKRVTIPLHPVVKNIINKYNDFPPVFSKNSGSNSTIFNANLKKLLKKAEINRMVYAKEYDVDDKRNYVKHIPLYKAASSHICRRSFASNYYGHPNFPTSLLIAITGHQYESTFLEYIGKNDISKALEIAKIFNS
ncbi:tyrosine-type recombinase/integrase [Empedobacter falsenii]